MTIKLGVLKQIHTFIHHLFFLRTKINISWSSSQQHKTQRTLVPKTPPSTQKTQEWTLPDHYPDQYYQFQRWRWSKYRQHKINIYRCMCCVRWWTDVNRLDLFLFGISKCLLRWLQQSWWWTSPIVLIRSKLYWIWWRLCSRWEWSGIGIEVGMRILPWGLIG